MDITQVAIKFIKRENIKNERHLLRVTREIHALKILGMTSTTLYIQSQLLASIVYLCI